MDRAPTERRRRSVAAAAALAGAALLVVLGLVVLEAVRGGGEADDAASGDASPAASGSDADPDELGAGDPTSAADGAEGTRRFADVPAEIPTGLVPDDATTVEGTVARDGDDWSAVVTYGTTAARDEVEDAIDLAAETAGYARRRATEDAARRVLVYEGEDGAVLTVTLTEDGDALRVGAVVVSP